MNDRKYFDVGEWQAWGGLQEANRLHFHPHGLALEVTWITDWDDAGPVMQARVATAGDVLRSHVGSILDEYDVDVDALAKAIVAAQYPVGSVHLSGIWDSREDPEGIIFGSWSDADRAKAEQVAEERGRHYWARMRMFGTDDGKAAPPDGADVEPTDWTYPYPEIQPS